MNLEDDYTIAQELASLALAMSAEKDQQKLLERIVESCMSLVNADGGTLYTVSDEAEGSLVFKVLRNRSLGLNDKPSRIPQVPLYDGQGQESKLVSVQTYLTREVIRVDDAYTCTLFDFSGTKAFDTAFGYRSQSFLSVPLADHEGDIIGILQLINAQDENGNIVPFNETISALICAVASLAATVLTKQKLIEGQKELLEAFIKLIGRAIDHKSPVTGKHCENVPEIAMVLAEAVNDTQAGKFKDLYWDEEDMYELRVAAWLHDCGKITSPEAIIEKGRKLSTLFDRIEIVATRFREYKQHLQIELLKRKLSGDLTDEQIANAEAQLNDTFEQLDNDLEFLRVTNLGGEHMSSKDQDRVTALGEIRWYDINGDEQTLLTEEEMYHLNIKKGTLTDEERQIMRDHIKVTIEMLESLPYPKPLSQVTEIACNHHECLDGTGYPRGLTANDLSTRARIMCIADIFEALTAADRPYKPGMLLSQTMNIMGRMVVEGKLDADLFALFIDSGAYLKYAKSHMAERQIDTIDKDMLPGYRPYLTN
ncbi:MAG: HD domain-containing phosphohydrolase [Pontibacterium sp.]